jgi:predicted ATPase
MDLLFEDYELKDVAQVNVILGKNGCGKSTLLRSFERDRRRDPNGGYTRYITPERGGVLNRDGNVETNISNNVDWLAHVRGKNRFEQFRQTSAAEFRRLETLVLRKIEKTADIRADHSYTFDSVVSDMNTLL